jgi:hypothetical protein
MTTVRVLVALGSLAAAFPVAAVMSLEDRVAFQCVGCHTGNAKSFTDPLTGKKKNTLMDIVRKQAADHADVACQKCHVKGFSTFPHFATKILRCKDCHPREGVGAQEDRPYDFGRIEQEFENTVHFTEHRKKFGCLECHHPHYFEATARLGAPEAILEHHNDMCLNCHAANATGQVDTIGARLTDPAEPNLVAEHASIPHAARHLRTTRCYDCHSGTNHVVSHALPIGENTPSCESCHSVDSVHARLYRYVDKPRQTAGFTHSAMLRDNYVMGATRYKPLDALTYVLAGGALLVIVAHGVMRFVRRKPPKTGDDVGGRR